MKKILFFAACLLIILPLSAQAVAYEYEECVYDQNQFRAIYEGDFNAKTFREYNGMSFIDSLGYKEMNTIARTCRTLKNGQKITSSDSCEYRAQQIKKFQAILEQENGFDYAPAVVPIKSLIDIKQTLLEQCKTEVQEPATTSRPDDSPADIADEDEEDEEDLTGPVSIAECVIFDALDIRDPRCSASCGNYVACTTALYQDIVTCHDAHYGDMSAYRACVAAQGDVETRADECLNTLNQEDPGAKAACKKRYPFTPPIEEMEFDYEVTAIEGDGELVVDRPTGELFSWEQPLTDLFSDDIHIPNVNAGMSVAFGDRITVPEGTSVRLRDPNGLEFTLGPTSEVTLHSLLIGQKFRYHMMQLERGLAEFAYPPGSGDLLGISTKDAIVKAQGTQFSVEATEAGTLVTVEEGSVTVQDANKTALVTVKKNHQSFVPNSGTPERPRRIAGVSPWWFAGGVIMIFGAGFFILRRKQ